MKLVRLALLATICAYAAGPAPPVPPKEIRKNLPLADGKQVFVEAGVGDITIRPGGAKQAEVLARIEADGDCADNKDRVARTEVLVDAIPEGIRVRTIQDKSKQNLGVLGAFIKTCDAPHVNLTLTLPGATRLEVRAERSTVDVQDMTSDVRLLVSRGRVNGRGLSGAADVDVRGGEVRVAFRKFDRPSRIQMMGGSIEVSLPKNTKFDVNYEGYPRGFVSDFPAQPREITHINGGGPRLDLSIMHGRCRLQATEPVPEPKPKSATAPKSGRTKAR